MEDYDNIKLFVSLTRTLLAHILYMRGMIPATIQQLDKYLFAYQQEEKKDEIVCSRNRKEQKKAIAVSKLINEINLLLSEFGSILVGSTKGLSESRLWVNVILGPTISNPRETYCMHFSPFQSSKIIGISPPLSEADFALRSKRLEKILVRRFLEFSVKNNFESSSLSNSSPSVTSKWNVFLSAAVLRPVCSTVLCSLSAMDCVLPGQTSTERADEIEAAPLSSAFEAAESSAVSGNMFCYREGSEFNLKQRPWNWPYDILTLATKANTLLGTEGFSASLENEAMRNVSSESMAKTEKKRKPVTMIRKKVSSNYPVEVTVDCCSGTISECSISRPQLNDAENEGGEAGKGSPMASSTPSAANQAKGQGDQEWAVSHWFVQRKGFKGIPERVYAV